MHPSSLKTFDSPGYRFVFNKDTGEFARWGARKQDNPQFSPFGPEIADIEISTICSQGCKWCYKSNTATGKNMSLETFKRVFEVLPKETLTQIAFGIGDVDANPDVFPIFRYARDNGVIPNVTINGYRLTSQIICDLIDVCGAVAVSNYNPEVCYSAVALLTSYGLKQVNIHQLLSAETYDQCENTLIDYLIDQRLAKLNAIVFLSLKQKGRGRNLHSATKLQLKFLSAMALEKNIPIGFDSCSANTFLDIAKELGRDDLETCVEPCESSLFSAYIDVDANFLPCSFSSGLFQPIPVINKDFIKDIWNEYSTVRFREKLLSKDRNCPFYKVIQ